MIIISLWTFWNGQTPGKKILNLKIVSEKYEKIDTKTAIIRYIGYYINILTLMTGFAIIAFREDKRGLHDIIAKTYVIHTDKEKTNFENDTADKIFAIISILSGISLIIFIIITYQETKLFNKMIYGTNNTKIIKQKQNQMKQQNKAMINEMNKMNKQTTEMFKN
ncbi:MAG: RDD family protein [Sulfurimonas sp.]